MFHLGYIDPGTGSILWQAVMGGVLGGTYLLRNTIAKVFHRHNKTDKRSDSTD